MTQTDISKATVSQQPQKRDWVPIIVGAVAAVLGGGILTTVPNSLGSYIFAPSLQVLIRPDIKHNGSNATILMVNFGGTAKHVKLTVIAPEDIIGRIYGFSTENISLQRGGKILQADLPRFVQGEGSLVNISLAIKAKPNINYTNSYAAFVTYDEGSNTGGYSFKPSYYRIISILVFISYPAVSILVIFLLIRRLKYKRRIKYYRNSLDALLNSTGYTAAEKKRSLERLSDSIREPINKDYAEGKLRRIDFDRLMSNTNYWAKKLEEEIKILEQHQNEL